MQAEVKSVMLCVIGLLQPARCLNRLRILELFYTHHLNTAVPSLSFVNTIMLTDTGSESFD